MTESDFDEINEKIRNKKFSHYINGYSPMEVDSFLDALTKNIEELKGSLEYLEKQLNNELTINSKQKSKIESLEKTIKRLKQSSKVEK
ncbi:DivIVA domain-containing protein [Mycoplasmopsis hyopharyngis]|uniref:DivIVA domain-containing protein n=1 Tax=Mycoplasmopsis hyopharyngis TaxID=29558 RepID=UPI0038739422